MKISSFRDVYKKHNIVKFYPVFFAVGVCISVYISTHIQAYASGNVFGSCAGLPQTQAICTDDACGTGVATNYSTLQYNGYLPGNGGACSQYCCTNIAASPTSTLTPTQTSTPTPIPTLSPTLTPTITATPASTLIVITVCPHGLGNCGDNVTPNIGGNKNPNHTQRPATINLFNGNDQLVASIAGALKYSSPSANFTVSIPVPTTITTGSYLVKITSDGLLTRQAPGIVQVTSGQTTTIPVIGLVTGNINNDTQIDILDYNLLINCFGSKQTTASCTTPPTATTAGSDINDDGVVNAADYNLFLRELSVQKGN